MEASAEDREALVQVIHQSENVSSNHEEPKQDSFRKYYTLPGVRYCTVFKAILFIDAIFSLVLWLTGGNSEYFIDSIVNFHLKESAFDLAVLNAAKVIIAFAVIDTMEETSLQLVDDPYNAKLIRKKLLAHIGLIVMLLLTFSYVVVKGGLILYALLNDTSYTKMHLTFNILTISAVVFGAVELITALTSFWAMKRLQVIRILHRVNESGEEVDEEGKKVKKKATLIRLIKLARPEAGIITWASLCLLVSAATQTVAPLFFGIVVDAASRSMEELNQTVLILLGIYMGGAIFSMFRAWLFTLAGQRFVARLRKELFSNIIKQDVAFFDTTRTGELTNRLASDTQVLQNAVTVNVSMLARYVLTIIGSLAFMFVLNSALTGVLLAVVPVVSIGAVQYGKFVMGIRKAFQDRLADASTTAEEAISSVRTVRSFTGEAKATAAYGKDIDKSYDQGKKLAIASGGFDGLIGMVANGAVLLVMWYGGKLIYEKQITAGQLTSFLVYTFQVAMAFAFVSSLYGDFMQAVGASVRIFDLLDQKPDIPLDQGISSEDALQGSLEFYNVKFTYPSRSDTQVLKGVTFSVSSGQMIALVGPSGGGKSTIVSLIERFYDPDSGYICLGGFELKSLSPLWFRSKVAIVSQEPTLFACSIRDNIAYGKDATEEQIIEAAKQANAHNFIMTFEEGYGTLVGERGVRLSGGQKQRVAIARALIMNPAVLLLDEATSALDAESEHLVQEAIDRAMLNRTVVVVAHRLSTVRNASKVLVVDKGQIVESGTHDELLAKKGVYKKLVYRQLMAGGQEEEGGSVEDSKETSQQGKEGDHSQEVLVHVSGHNAEAATGDMTSHQVVNGDDEQLINIE